MIRIISEQEFAARLRNVLEDHWHPVLRSVTGPGRSGAIASVYASRLLGIPWIPTGEPVPAHLLPVLVIDTARKTGASLRKAARRTGAPEAQIFVVVIYEEPPRLRFWYEREAFPPE
jgi:hypothetical protein